MKMEVKSRTFIFKMIKYDSISVSRLVNIYCLVTMMHHCHRKIRKLRGWGYKKPFLANFFWKFFVIRDVYYSLPWIIFRAPIICTNLTLMSRKVRIFFYVFRRLDMYRFMLLFSRQGKAEFENFYFFEKSKFFAEFSKVTFLSGKQCDIYFWSSRTTTDLCHSLFKINVLDSFNIFSLGGPVKNSSLIGRD